MRILCCGDRHWFSKNKIREVLKQYDPENDILIHGDANGADRLSAEIARELGWKEENILSYPADWTKFGASAGPIRNRQMLREGKPEIVHAFHSDIQNSKGTKDMKQISEQAGLTVELHI